MYPLSHQQAVKPGKKMVLVVPFFTESDGNLRPQHALFVPCVYMLALTSQENNWKPADC